MASALVVATSAILVLESALDLIGKVLNLGKTNFEREQAWIEYESVLRRVRVTLVSHQAVIATTDFGPEDPVALRLEDAKEELSRAHRELRNVQRRCGCCTCFKCPYVFPEVLKLRIKFLQDLPKAISDDLKTWKEFEELVKRIQTREHVLESNILPLDGGFVPLEKYQTDLYAALGNSKEGAPLVIFLSGEQGIGKSTMALDTAANVYVSVMGTQCEQGIGKSTTALEAVVNGKETRGKQGDGKTTIALDVAANGKGTHGKQRKGTTVVNVDAAAHGNETHGEQRKGKSTVALEAAANMKETRGNQEESHSLPSFPHVLFIPCGGYLVNSDYVEKELKRRLGLSAGANRNTLSRIFNQIKLLIIFDDVHDFDIPKKVIELGWLSRSGLKFIITSNHGSVCKNCPKGTVKSIFITTITDDEAKKILASHCNLELVGGDVPSQLQGVVGEVMKKTGKIPLTLALFAKALDQSRVHDPKEWVHVLTSIDAAMGQQEDPKIYGAYPHSFWKLMQVITDKLDENSKALLTLLSRWQSETGLETDIQREYDYLKSGTPEMFRKARMDLQANHLIQIQHDHEFVYTWSIHPLKMRFLRGEVATGLPKPSQSETNAGCSPTQNIIGHFIGIIRNLVYSFFGLGVGWSHVPQEYE